MLLANLKFHCKDKHIDIQYHFIKEEVQMKEKKTIVMTFLVRECYGSPKKQEFYRILIGKQCNLVNIRG
jgi:hypothetical protein